MKILPGVPVALVVLLLGLFSNGVALADPEADPPDPPDPHLQRGFTLVARIAAGVPAGTTAGRSNVGPGGIPTGTPGTGIDQTETAGLMLAAVGVDAAYRITPSFHLGGYFQAGFDTGGFLCGCTGYDLRFGVDAELHLAPRAHGDGWIGLGTGYEILHTGQSTLSTAYRGFEFGSASAGVDFRTRTPAFRVGPYGGLAIGEYNHIHQVSPTSDVSTSLPSQAIHAWAFVGIRGRFDL